MSQADDIDMLPAVQRRSKEMAERLLNAGEKVFSEHGFKGAKLSDIAIAANCSVGAVYSRFKDKEALFLAILKRFAAQSQQQVAGYFGGPATQSVPTAEILRNFVVATGHTFRRHHGMFRAIVEHGFDDQVAASVIVTLREQNEAVVLGFLRSRLPEAGPELDFRVRVALQMLNGFLFVGLLNRQAPVPIVSEQGLDEVAEALVATLGLKEQNHGH
jgi:AcrR family transcriptional regulator